MKGVKAILIKELQTTFYTPLPYVIFAGFLFLAGFFFFSIVEGFNGALTTAAVMGEEVPSVNELIYQYFGILQVVLVFMIPALTMRAVAEEKRSGTFELLATSPVSVTGIILGKYLALSVVMGLMLLFSLLFPLVLVVYSNPEVMPVFIGFVGLLLFALSFTSLGLAISAFCRSQTVSAVVGTVALLVFYMIDAPAASVSGMMYGEHIASFLRYLAPGTHTDMMLRGVFEARHVVYFFSLVLLGLFLANRALEAERGR